MKLQNFLIILGVLFLGAGCTPRIDTLETAPESKEVTAKTDFTADDRAEWKKIVQWSDLCDEDFKIGSDAGLGGLALYPLNETQSILRVTCGVYAYQTSMLFYHLDTSTPETTVTSLAIPTYDMERKQVVARTYEYEDDIANYVLGNDSFDSVHKTISIFTKERGVGDCGSRTTFAAEKTPTLLKFESLSCEQAEQYYIENPDAKTVFKWPVVYEKK